MCARKDVQGCLSSYIYMYKWIYKENMLYLLVMHIFKNLNYRLKLLM